MSAEVSYGIGVEIVPEGFGEKKILSAMDNIIKRGKAGAAANDNFADTFDKISKKSDGAAKSTGKIGTILDDIKGRAAGAVPAVGNLLSKLMAFGPMGGILAGVGISIGAIIALSTKAASKVEVWKANLLTMTKNTKAADAAYRELVAFSAATPFSNEQSVNGFIKMRALGLETSTAIMTSFGNTAAAMGKDMSQIVEAVADATTGEFERLKEFGIKASQEGNKVKFTFQGVTTEVDKNSSAIQKYIVGIGATKFGGAMARQAATAQGAFAQLEDQVFNTFAAMGDGALNKAIGKITNGVTDGLAAITPLLSGIMDVVGGILSFVVDVGAGFLSMFTGGATGAATLKTGLDNLAVGFAFVGEWITMIGKVTGSVFGFIGDVIGMVTGAIRSGFGEVFSWLLPTTQSAGQSMGESFVGVLRAASYVAGQLPSIFGVALAELKAMFTSAGAALAASLTGDFSKWGNVDLSMGRTQKVVSRVLSNAGKVQQDQKGNRAWIDEKSGKLGKGNIDFAALGKDKAPGDKKKKAGETDAEKRAKQEKEFWETLKGQAATAALLPLEAENYTKQLELQKILGRDLNKGEKDRLATAMQTVRTNQFFTDALDARNKKTTEQAQQQELFGKQLKGMTEDQAAVEKQVYEFRNAALAKGVDLQSEAYKAEEAATRAVAQRGVQIDKNNKMLADGVELFKQYSPTAAKDQITKDFADKRAALTLAYNKGDNGGKYSAETFGKAMAKVTKDEAKQRRELDEQLRDIALDKWSTVIYGLADVFGGAFEKFAQGFDQLAGSLKGQSGIGGLMKGLGLKDEFNGGLSKMFGKDSIFGKNGALGKTFTSLFGKNGTLVKGLGKTIGQMGAGAQVGQITSTVMKGLGIKTSGTGAQLGGALGSFAGPLGSIGGSILGGIVGGMLKKAKWGTTSISNGVATTSGNKSAYKDNASSAGNSLTSGLDKIAEQLGAEVGGNYNVSMGQYNGKWRVSTSGRTGKLKGKYSDVTDFGKDGAEEALAFALSDAIKDGAITGLRATTQFLLAAGDDIEAQLTKALRFEGVFKELKARVDPVGAAVDALNLEFKSLTKVFEEAGATSAEYADLEKLRSLKLQDIIKEQTSSFQSILDNLNGEAGGFSAMSLLNKNRAAFDVFKADIAAGKSVDQEAFSKVADALINGVNNVFGTNSSQGQSILNDVRKTTTDAMALVTNEITSLTTATDTVSVLQKQTDVYAAGTAETNSWLKEISATLKANASSLFSGNSGGSTQNGNVNGRLTMAY
ncbi:hypothetical protein ACT9ST_08460 [Sphingobium limneticum]